MPKDPARPPDGPGAEAPFPYMRFAKAELTAPGPANLGMSGTNSPTAAEQRDLGLALGPPYAQASAAFREAVATHQGVAAEQVFPAVGSSHANFAVAQALARGGRILTECPAYEALPALAAAVGADLSTFERDAKRDYAIREASLRAAAEQGADLIAVTDLHNPSGCRLSEQDYALLQDVADEHDAYVLVDEVYAAFDPERRAPAATRGPRFVSTNSLTKVHGLGALRAGWVAASPELIQRIETWDDLAVPMLVGTSLEQAAGYLPCAEERAARIRDRAAERIDQVERWVAATPGITWVRPHGGISAFLRIGDGPEADQGDQVAEHVHEHHGVRVVPGSYFQRPAWVRISFGLPLEDLALSLDALARSTRMLFGSGAAGDEFAL